MKSNQNSRISLTLSSFSHENQNLKRIWTFQKNEISTKTKPCRTQISENYLKLANQDQLPSLFIPPNQIVSIKVTANHFHTLADNFKNYLLRPQTLKVVKEVKLNYISSQQNNQRNHLKVMRSSNNNRCRRYCKKSPALDIKKKKKKLWWFF